MKKFILCSLLLLVAMIIFMPDGIFAQPPGFPGMPQQAPIDGGLTLLVLGGGAYALKKLRDKKK